MSWKEEIHAQEEEKSSVKEGQVVKGRVIDIRDESVVIDIGHKSAGSVPKSEFTANGQTFDLKVGDLIDVFVEVFEDDALEAEFFCCPS